MSDRTKISVSVITYNQEDTIRQTLDSILMQKGDFDLEIVIGEDCSSDNTYAICKEYEMRYTESTNGGVPETVVRDESREESDGKRVVRLLQNTHNLGIMANVARVMQACMGDFIGGIAGDDFYHDDRALEKQVNYFKKNPDVGVLGANGYRFYVRSGAKVPGVNHAIEGIDSKAKQFYFSPQYRGGVYFTPTGLMVRREMMKYIDFDEIIRRKLPVEDYPMQAIWSQYTKFACLPDLLVTYRVYQESATFISFEHPKYLSYHKGLANTRRYLNELFPEDACFSEEELQEYEFYKEFLLYLHQKDYQKAKQLINDAASISNTPKVRQAKRFTKTWLHFIVAHYIKERKYRQDLKERI